MDVDTTTGPALEAGADTIAVGLLDGEADALDALGLSALLDRGEAKPEFRHLAVGHIGETRVIVIGLGAEADLDPERMRIAAAFARNRAAELGSSHLSWELPGGAGSDG